MIRAVGLDISCSRTGLTLPDGTSRSIVPRNGPKQPALRLVEIAGRIRSYLALHPHPQIALVEGYQLTKQPSTFTAIRIGECGGAARAALADLQIPFLEIPPAIVKQYATGDAHADKEHMVDQARREGAHVDNHDEADSWWLWRISQPVNPNGPNLDLRHKIRNQLDWPTAFTGGDAA